MSDDTRKIISDLNRYYFEGNLEKFAAMIHEDIDWILNAPIDVFPFAGRRRGREAVLKALGDFGQSYSLERYDPQIRVVDGDCAAVLSDVSVRQRSTGRMLRFHIAEFLRFRDGMLVEFREFSNTFDVVEQVLGRWLQV